MAGWLGHVRGTVAEPPTATCAKCSEGLGVRAGEDDIQQDSECGRVFDFFVLPECLSSCVRDVQVISDGPLLPRSPDLLRLASLSETAVVQQQVRYKPFGISVMGLLPDEKEVH